MNRRGWEKIKTRIENVVHTNHYRETLAFGEIFNGRAAFSKKREPATDHGQ